MAIDPEDYMSASDMRQWAAQELKDVTKAAELRTKQVNQLADDYAAGRISPKEANEQHALYRERWGEALPGATMNEGLSDEALLARMDTVRGEMKAARRTSGKAEWKR